MYWVSLIRKFPSAVKRNLVKVVNMNVMKQSSLSKKLYLPFIEHVILVSTAMVHLVNEHLR